MNSQPMQARRSPFANPWVQLVIGIMCMACVANLQYGWTLFVDPIDAKYHWGRAYIQVAFTIFVMIETWLVPVEGYLVDRYGPRWVVLGGAILVAVAWALNSSANTLPPLYLGAAIGGVGTGAVYGTCVGNALKWFPGGGVGRGCDGGRFWRRRGNHHRANLQNDRYLRLRTRLLFFRPSAGRDRLRTRLGIAGRAARRHPRRGTQKSNVTRIHAGASRA